MIEKFKNIFEGLTIAYGQYQKGDRSENGKQKGKAFIVRKKVTDDLWKDHINGKGPALGIIPITEDNNCKWVVLILMSTILIIMLLSLVYVN